MRISDVIGTKSSKDVITIAPDATVRDLIRLLGQHNVGALIVSTDGAAVDGIVSERDVVRHLLDSDDILDGAVSAIMTVDVATAAPDTSLDEMRALMTERRIRHVPILDGGELVGIVSIGDVVKSRIGELESENSAIIEYIQTGR